MKKKFVVPALLAVLAVCLATWQACKIPSWVSTVEGIAKVAVPIAGQIADVVDPAATPIVKEVVDAFNVFIKALDQYKADPNATTLQAVESAFAVAAANVQALENAVNASGHVPEVVAAVIGLISTMVNEIASDLPATPATKKFRTAAAKHFTGDDFLAQFNALAAKYPQLHAIP